MYSGALMPASPIKPMNNPWPIHSGQGGPRVEIERPRPIINAPKITVQRVPIRSATRDMRMPPMPEPNHASALASAGTERDPPTSLAMSLSATTLIQAAPNDIPRMKSATRATAQEFLVSTETGDCNIGGKTRLANLLYRPPGVSPPASMTGLLYVLHCIKNDVRGSLDRGHLSKRPLHQP